MDYCFMKCGDTSKNVPYKIIKEYDNFALCELVRYPSYYGMSRPYRECIQRQDMTRLRTAEQVISWVENGKDYRDTQIAAEQGNEWARGIIKEWKEVKKKL